MPFVYYKSSFDSWRIGSIKKLVNPDYYTIYDLLSSSCETIHANNIFIPKNCLENINIFTKDTIDKDTNNFTSFDLCKHESTNKDLMDYIYYDFTLNKASNDDENINTNGKLLEDHNLFDVSKTIQHSQSKSIHNYIDVNSVFNNMHVANLTISSKEIEKYKAIIDNYKLSPLLFMEVFPEIYLQQDNIMSMDPIPNECPVLVHLLKHRLRSRIYTTFISPNYAVAVLPNIYYDPYVPKESIALTAGLAQRLAFSYFSQCQRDNYTAQKVVIYGENTFDTTQSLLYNICCKYFGAEDMIPGDNSSKAKRFMRYVVNLAGNSITQDISYFQALESCHCILNSMTQNKDGGETVVKHLQLFRYSEDINKNSTPYETGNNQPAYLSDASSLDTSTYKFLKSIFSHVQFNYMFISFENLFQSFLIPSLLSSPLLFKHSIESQYIQSMNPFHIQHALAQSLRTCNIKKYTQLTAMQKNSSNLYLSLLFMCFSLSKNEASLFRIPTSKSLSFFFEAYYSSGDKSVQNTGNQQGILPFWTDAEFALQMYKQYILVKQSFEIFPAYMFNSYMQILSIIVNTLLLTFNINRCYNMKCLKFFRNDMEDPNLEESVQKSMLSLINNLSALFEVNSQIIYEFFMPTFNFESIQETLGIYSLDLLEEDYRRLMQHNSMLMAYCSILYKNLFYFILKESNKLLNKDSNTLVKNSFIDIIILPSKKASMTVDENDIYNHVFPLSDIFINTLLEDKIQYYHRSLEKNILIWEHQGKCFNKKIDKIFAHFDNYNILKVLKSRNGLLMLCVNYLCNQNQINNLSDINAINSLIPSLDIDESSALISNIELIAKKYKHVLYYNEFSNFINIKHSFGNVSYAFPASNDWSMYTSVFHPLYKVYTTKLKSLSHKQSHMADILSTTEDFYYVSDPNAYTIPKDIKQSEVIFSNNIFQLYYDLTERLFTLFNNHNSNVSPTTENVEHNWWIHSISAFKLSSQPCQTSDQTDLKPLMPCDDFYNYNLENQFNHNSDEQSVAMSPVSNLIREQVDNCYKDISTNCKYQNLLFMDSNVIANELSYILIFFTIEISKYIPNYYAKVNFDFLLKYYKPLSLSHAFKLSNFYNHRKVSIQNLNCKLLEALNSKAQNEIESTNITNNSAHKYIDYLSNDIQKLDPRKAIETILISIGTDKYNIANDLTVLLSTDAFYSLEANLRLLYFSAISTVQLYLHALYSTHYIHKIQAIPSIIKLSYKKREDLLSNVYDQTDNLFEQNLDDCNYISIGKMITLKIIEEEQQIRHAIEDAALVSLETLKIEYNNKYSVLPSNVRSTSSKHKQYEPVFQKDMSNLDENYSILFKEVNQRLDDQFVAQSKKLDGILDANMKKLVHAYKNGHVASENKAQLTHNRKLKHLKIQEEKMDDIRYKMLKRNEKIIKHKQKKQFETLKRSEENFDRIEKARQNKNKIDYTLEQINFIKSQSAMMDQMTYNVTKKLKNEMFNKLQYEKDQDLLKFDNEKMKQEELQLKKLRKYELEKLKEEESIDKLKQYEQNFYTNMQINLLKSKLKDKKNLEKNENKKIHVEKKLTRSIINASNKLSNPVLYKRKLGLDANTSSSLYQTTSFINNKGLALYNNPDVAAKKSTKPEQNTDGEIRAGIKAKDILVINPETVKLDKMLRSNLKDMKNKPKSINNKSALIDQNAWDKLKTYYMDTTFDSNSK